jgi:hypothetical protein
MSAFGAMTFLTTPSERSFYQLSPDPWARWIGRSEHDVQVEAAQPLIIGAFGAISLPRPSERPFHLESWINPWPVLHPFAETRRDGIPTNIVRLGLELFAPFIISQSMIEESVLPSEAVFPRVETFPIRNYATHLSIRCKRSQSVQMIRHQEKDDYVPTILFLVETH